MRVGVDMLNRAMGAAGLTGAVIQHPRTAQQSCETVRGNDVEFNLILKKFLSLDDGDVRKVRQ